MRSLSASMVRRLPFLVAGGRVAVGPGLGTSVAVTHAPAWTDGLTRLVRHLLRASLPHGGGRRLVGSPGRIHASDILVRDVGRHAPGPVRRRLWHPAFPAQLLAFALLAT